MIRSLFLICILSLNLSAENNEQTLKESLLKFWEARNARDFETIFFYTILNDQFPLLLHELNAL